MRQGDYIRRELDEELNLNGLTPQPNNQEEQQQQKLNANYFLHKRQHPQIARLTLTTKYISGAILRQRKTNWINTKLNCIPKINTCQP